MKSFEKLFRTLWRLKCTERQETCSELCGPSQTLHLKRISWNDHTSNVAIRLSANSGFQKKHIIINTHDSWRLSEKKILDSCSVVWYVVASLQVGPSKPTLQMPASQTRSLYVSLREPPLLPSNFINMASLHGLALHRYRCHLCRLGSQWTLPLTSPANLRESSKHAMWWQVQSANVLSSKPHCNADRRRNRWCQTNLLDIDKSPGSKKKSFVGMCRMPTITHTYNHHYHATNITMYHQYAMANSHGRRLQELVPFSF